MKKFCAFLLAAALLLALSVGCLAAGGLNTGIQIDDSQSGKILVTVADSDSESFETLQPTLTVACPFSACYVTFGGTVIASTLRDGKVSFPVRAGGIYTVQEGAAPADPVTPSDPVTPVAPSGSPSTATPAETTQTPQFSDVPAASWYAEAAEYAVKNGLMTGTGNNKFSPNADTTRGMVMTILARMAGQNTAGTPWYAAGMAWAKTASVSDGTNPEAPVTREQLITMLFRYAVKNGLEAVTLAENLSQFTDVSSVSAWAVSAMQWAVGQDLIQGSNGQLRPQASATRAEVAAILMRFCGLMNR